MDWISLRHKYVPTFAHFSKIIIITANFKSEANGKGAWNAIPTAQLHNSFMLVVIYTAFPTGTTR